MDALRLAVWRNDLIEVSAVLKRHPSLTEKADEESGWTPLHAALYFGHLRIAVRLLEAGARLDAEDDDGRMPLELISKELRTGDASRTEVFSWGCGVNFQLGTGQSGLQKMPRRLEKLTDCGIIELTASKFHSMALSRDGKVYTWGWGFGGRLGHPDASEHGNVQIFPRIVKALAGERVICIAAAKHHSLAVTSNGDVYSWGQNPDGRLGHPVGGRQIVPKRVLALKGVHVVQAAAANKHSAIVSNAGVVYTWGSNAHGQLGYGTFDSGSNPNPRCVEALQHKRITHVSLAKKHSLALSEDGEIYSWGHKRVAPKKVPLSGSQDSMCLNNSGMPIQFHRGSKKLKKPIAVMIAAGAHRSCCLTAAGAMLSWRSKAPHSGLSPIGGNLSGKKVTSISAGKTMTAASTLDGLVYTWEGTEQPKPVCEMKNASAVAVGEMHCLALQRWNAGHTSASGDAASESISMKSESCSSSLSKGASIFGDLDLDDTPFKILAQQKTEKKSKDVEPLLSLQVICEKVVAQHILSPRTAVQLFTYADTVGAEYLRRCSLWLLVHNLALVIHESHQRLPSVSDDLLLEIEQMYQEQILHVKASDRSSWWITGNGSESDVDIGSRRLTYGFSCGHFPSSPSVSSMTSASEKPASAISSGNRFLPPDQSVQKVCQRMQRKLREIESLLQKRSNGVSLEKSQNEKIARKGIYVKALAAANQGASYQEVQQILTESLPVEHSDAQKQSGKKKTLSVVKNNKTLSEGTSTATSSPNLLPVKPVQKSRDIGRLPRFLEPSWKERHSSRKLSDLSSEETEFPSLCDAMSELSVPEKKWMTFELQQPTSKQGMQSLKAIPSKGHDKMSLGDFLTTPTEPPLPVKKSGPAWGGVKFSSASSFEMIQNEQRNLRPGLMTIGLKPAVERRHTAGRWQLHSDVQHQSIPSIQTEEKAVRELSALYGEGTVRVKIGTARGPDATSNNR